MDLQTRKLKAIEYLIGLRDERVFKKIESVIVEVRKQQTLQRKIKPYTTEEVFQRAEQSSEDYKNRNYMSQDDLEKESENW